MYFFLDPSFAGILQRALPGPTILFIALLLPEIFYSSLATRYATFLAIATCSAAVFREHQIPSQIVSYFMGFTTVWTTVLSANYIIIKHPSKDFKRIRKCPSHKNIIPQYEWEAFPKDLDTRRFFWVVDLMCNPCATGWSHQTKVDNPPPAVRALYAAETGKANRVREVKADGYHFEGVKVNGHHFEDDLSASVINLRSGRVQFLVKRATQFILDWFLVEVATHGMTLDPFLNGSEEINLLRIPLSNALHFEKMVSYRAAIVCMGCYGLIDLFFVSVSLLCVSLGPGMLGTWGETWMYSRHWGNPLAVYYRGLAGAWGTAWHDLFHMGFVTFARALVPSPPSSPPNSTRRCTRLLLIFALSGLMHAAGSYIQSANTSPPLTFITFCLQGIGIIVQNSLVACLERINIKGETRRIFVCIYAMVWIYLVFPVFMIDMAAGGIFRTKFLPVSLTGLWLGNEWPGWFKV